ncbi:MAG: FecR domain-containing protein [Rhodocyclaceae bacterium]|nr:FecR domain-containing protein [Rhodocyclaceae bacterium]
MPPAEKPAAGGAPDARQQAALWLIELQDDAGNPELRARWQRWHDASPEHREAWAKLEAFGASLRQMPASLTQAALAPRKPARRRAVKALALLIAGGGAALLAVGPQNIPIHLAGQRTGAGERRRIVLDDGSRIDLNADSALDIHFNGSERRLHLHAGEIHVATAPDDARRPFFVDTPHGRAQALGTRFTVRTGDGKDGSRVAVYEGSVAIRPRLATDAEPLILAAGRQGSFGERATGPAGAANEADAAWTRGILVAEDTPLPAFIAELARLSGRPMHCDPALAALKVSGTYPLADPDAVLALLARALPIRIERRQRWWGAARHEILPA